MIGALDEALISIPGVPESQLPCGVAASLPDRAPGSPWHCEVTSVFWFHKARPGAAEALPEVLRGLPRLPVTIGALIRYLDSPVGPYAEVIAAPVLVRRPFPQANVAFIAVDSQASVVGGRSNWALPKVLARFDGDIGSDGQATSTAPRLGGAGGNEASGVAIADVAALLLLSGVAGLGAAPLAAHGPGVVPPGGGRRRSQLVGTARHLAGVRPSSWLHLRGTPAGRRRQTVNAKSCPGMSTLAIVGVHQNGQVYIRTGESTLEARVVCALHRTDALL